MHTDDDDLLDELVMTCLERVEHEGHGAIDDVCADHPERADALRKRLAGLASAGLLGEPDAPPELLGDFRVGRKLGGGGMGIVYAAVQQSLDRDVALKIVRADQLYFPGARERFRRELRIIARLAHANIVPVYSGGEHEGVPYFAMEKLRGATLAEALAVLDEPARRGSDIARAVERVVEQRDEERVDVRGEIYEHDGLGTSLAIAERVALALDHAHQRDVLHRDVKPSNVMLTTDGRALVFDFGLASSADAPRVTESGSRVGSLAYMSPEQVRGGDVDERSDVYGIGALLFEALTLRPPHAGSLESVGAAILSGEEPSVRALRRDVPRDVETIVQTALAHRREDRYASAAALARDLGHVLARRPIEARRPSTLVRGVRWVQRHPAQAALLALLVIVPTVFAVQQRLATGRVEAERVRADSNLDQLLESVDALVWGFGEGFLAHAPGRHEERIELLRAARGTLASIRSQRPDDAGLERQWARIHGALGEVALETGALDVAEQNFKTALASGAAGELGLRDTVGLRNGYGSLLLTAGRIERAAATFVSAADAARADASLRDAEAASLRNASRALARLGRDDEARVAADAAVAAADEFAANVGDDERVTAQFGTVQTLVWRARLSAFADTIMLAQRENDVIDTVAVQAYDRGLPLALELAASHPSRADIVLEAAFACSFVRSFRPSHEHQELLEHGIELVDGLSASFPERVFYSQIRIGLVGQLGQLHSAYGRGDQALAAFTVAAREAERWRARSPDRIDVLEAAASAHGNLAASLVQLGRRAEACDPAERSARDANAILAESPDHSTARHTLHWAQVQNGYGRIARGEFEAALALAESIPADALDSPIFAISAGELLAGCAQLAPDDDTRRALRDRAFARLDQGLDLGFAAIGYLREADEWSALRNDPRFDEIMTRPERGRVPEALRRVKICAAMTDSTTTTPVRIAMWSGPRNISTALMRAWENRSDTTVWDEPLYAHYLRATGVDHPGAQEVIDHHDDDWRSVTSDLVGAIPDGCAVWYQKHMAHHLLPDIDRGWLDSLVHAFLIRDPKEMLLSLVRNIPDPRIEDTGLPQQVALYDAMCAQGKKPPVLDSRDVLENPEGQLRALCDAIDVAFDPAMLSWPAGSRDTDGVWARHWYTSVDESTCFGAYRPKPEGLPTDLRALHAECRPYYEQLHAQRLQT